MSSTFNEGALLALADQTSIYLWKVYIHKGEIEKEKQLKGVFQKKIDHDLNSTPSLYIVKNRFLIALEHSQICFWDLDDQKPFKQHFWQFWRQPTAMIKLSKEHSLESQDISLDGALLAACYTHGELFKIYLWNIETQEKLTELELKSPRPFFSSAVLRLSPDKRYLLLWNISQVHLWEVHSPSSSLLWRYPPALQACNLNLKGVTLDEGNKAALQQLGAKI